ncbi:hypothetical protein I7I51_00743 [Histoplasma capsulatum]|uniref:Uncharacterized protein n=1 Tax=Ajellomyces capsulatus TaxID=5037 RepID=A0A8A1MGF8_AJECA|nr:hypothetical protein I7I51_00743 [Histoplasma capsulatum]
MYDVLGDIKDGCIRFQRWVSSCSMWKIQCRPADRYTKHSPTSSTNKGLQSASKRFQQTSFRRARGLLMKLLSFSRFSASKSQKNRAFPSSAPDIGIKPAWLGGRVGFPGSGPTLNRDASVLGKNLKRIWINTRKSNGKESWIRILKTSLRLTDEMEALKAKRQGNRDVMHQNTLSPFMGLNKPVTDIIYREHRQGRLANHVKATTALEMREDFGWFCMFAKTKVRRVHQLKCLGHQ